MIISFAFHFIFFISLLQNGVELKSKHLEQLQIEEGFLRKCKYAAACLSHSDIYKIVKSLNGLEALILHGFVTNWDGGFLFMQRGASRHLKFLNRYTETKYSALKFRIRSIFKVRMIVLDIYSVS